VSVDAGLIHRDGVVAIAVVVVADGDVVAVVLVGVGAARQRSDTKGRDTRGQEPGREQGTNPHGTDSSRVGGVGFALAPRRTTRPVASAGSTHPLFAEEYVGAEPLIASNSQ
jgi:hypothetical protein